MHLISFKKNIVVFLLFVIVGAFFFCTLTIMASAGDVAHNMPSHQKTFMAHLFYINELTMTTIIEVFIDVVGFLLMSVFVSLLILYRFSYSWQFTVAGYIRQKWLNILYIINLVIKYWFSLIERSPNFVKLS